MTLRAVGAFALIGALTGLNSTGPSLAQDGEREIRTRDRGSGIPVSMFGTYVRRNEWLVYPFFEYYYDHDIEYKPLELGYGLDRDFRGAFRASEGILFVGYGLTDRLAIEFEAAVITARQQRDPTDPVTPATIKESGSGDVEGQIRFRFLQETERRPEVFGFVEAVSPQRRDQVLIGTPDWEFKGGAGVVRGNRWGTVSARVAGEYLVEDSSFDLGEYGVEYLRRLSRRWRVYAGFEGVQDEVTLITEVQWHFGDFAFLKLNNGVGVTSKATDWAPEVGIMFSRFASR